jgi:hypothetical protein
MDDDSLEIMACRWSCSLPNVYNESPDGVSCGKDFTTAELVALLNKVRESERAAHKALRSGIEKLIAGSDMGGDVDAGALQALLDADKDES